MFLDNSEAASVKDEVLHIRQRYDNLQSKLDDRGSNLETIHSQVEKFNRNYLEVSEWLERAEKFQSEQKCIEMNLQSIRILIKEQKVIFLFSSFSLFSTLLIFSSLNLLFS